jgi:hypothetical protein
MAKKRKLGFSLKYFVIAAALMLFALLIIDNGTRPVACTMEAKICPDGSAVGRVPPNCDFAPCPSGCVCPQGYVLDGEVCNPSCYYETPKCLRPSFLCSQAKSCTADSDCVGSECCHPTSCININYKGVCNQLCTNVCQGPLDCGTGTCGCVNNVCTVIPK